MVVVGVVGLLGALYALGTWGDDDNGGALAERDRATPTATPTPARKKKRKPAAPTRVTLQIVPTGTVNVCLVDANGKALINSETLQAGQQTPALPRQRFRVTFGNGQARMRVGQAGRSTCPDRSTPVGYELRPGKRPRELSEAQRPTCSVSGAGILITGTEVLSGIISDRNGPVAVRAPARARRRGRRTS